jgi:hypothetical protein
LSSIAATSFPFSTLVLIAIFMSAKISCNGGFK